MENLVEDVLKRFKITPRCRGYGYTIHAVKITLNDNTCLRYVTKQVYPEIAKKYKTNWKNVERNIRTVAEAIWKNGGKEFFYEFTGEYIEKRPRNAKFLELMAEYVMIAQSNDLGVKERCSSCPIVKKLESDIDKLERENIRLNGTIEWMHELIWELMDETKEK